MKYFKILSLLFFVSFASIGLAQPEDSTIIDQTEITTNQPTTDTAKDQNIPDLINQIGEDATPIIDAIKDPNFPPKTPGAWIAFIFATMIPVLTKVIGDKAKYSSIFQSIKLTGNTNAIIIWVSILLAGIYEGIVSQVDFSFPDWGGYALLTYGFGMGIHEIFKSLRKNPKL